MILSTMEAKVTSLTSLNDRLDNIAWFAGQVDHLRSINNLLAGIVSKLPLRYGEEWKSGMVMISTIFFCVSMSGR